MSQSQSQSVVAPGKRWPWLETAAFVAPLVVHMLLPSIVGAFFAEGDSWEKFVATMGVQLFWGVGLLLFFRSTYLSHFRFRVSWLAIPIGIVGFLAWVGICHLNPERSLLSLVGLENLIPSRAGVDPFTEFTGSQQVTFLVMRFTILALLVPLVEELFLRGWLIRWIQDVDWTSVRITDLGFRALLVPCIYGALTHPEILAAVVWFGAVTWLMVKTKSIWSCVVAHMITNLLLGLYVVQTGNWELW